GHLDVEHDQIGRRVSQPGHGVLTGYRFDDRVAFPFEQGAQVGAEHVVVVDDEDAGYLVPAHDPLGDPLGVRYAARSRDSLSISPARASSRPRARSRRPSRASRSMSAHSCAEPAAPITALADFKPWAMRATRTASPPASERSAATSLIWLSERHSAQSS